MRSSGKNGTFRLREKIALWLFVLSLVIWGFLYGFLAGHWGLPPARSMEQAIYNAQDFLSYWKNDLCIAPTRNLVPSYPGKKRFVVYDKREVTPGTVLISGLTWGRSAYFGAVLLDGAGHELHYWPVNFKALSAARSPEHIFLHGLAVFPDGSIIIDSDGGDVLAKIGPCGKTLWSRRGNYTHVVSASYDGSVWSWKGVDTVQTDSRAGWSWKGADIVQTDSRTGRTLKDISLERDIIERHHLQSLFWIRTAEGASEQPRYDDDPIHPNDVEVLSPALAGAFPDFSPGDLLVSFRSLNLVGVLDGKTYALKWYQIGPWVRQHDPDFEPDGSISILNNNMGLKHSEIDKVFPSSGRYEVLFRGSPAAPFYTWRRGKHQILPNGHILITETEHGRVFEVDGQGKVIWEFNNIYDKTRNGVVSNAIHLPPGFFTSGALTCRQASP